MIAFFLLCLPIFGVALAGYFAIRANWISLSAVDALGLFSFRFALPALAFRMLATQPIEASFNARFYFGYLFCGAVVFALVYSVSIVANAVPVAGAQATTASVSNLGFLGPPIIFALFGDRGVGPLGMAIMAEMIVLLALGCALMGKRRDARTPALQVAFGGLRTPLVAALIAGLSYAMTGLALPGPVDKFLGFLGGAAGPTALFALGATLAVRSINRSAVSAAILISLAKLGVYPAIAWLVLARWLELEAIWWQSGVILAALPSSGNLFVLAQRYETNPERISAAIMASTIASIATLPLTAWLVLG